jgi:hypothetical protein
MPRSVRSPRRRTLPMAAPFATPCGLCRNLLRATLPASSAAPAQSCQSIPNTQFIPDETMGLKPGAWVAAKLRAFSPDCITFHHLAPGIAHTAQPRLHLPRSISTAPAVRLTGWGDIVRTSQGIHLHRRTPVHTRNHLCRGKAASKLQLDRRSGRNSNNMDRMGVVRTWTVLRHSNWKQIRRRLRGSNELQTNSGRGSEKWTLLR